MCRAAHPEMSSTCSTIRKAVERDLPEIHRLLREANLSGAPEFTADTRTKHSYLLVLDAPDDGLAAVAMLVR